jgi:hypothetical protein
MAVSSQTREEIKAKINKSYGGRNVQRKFPFDKKRQPVLWQNLYGGTSAKNRQI